MEVKNNEEIKVAASALGILIVLGGASHGPGEILQGNVAPSNIVFQAWPALTALAGEPAMTIIPNLLVTGILTIIVGVLVAVWAAKFISRKRGGLVLILLFNRNASGRWRSYSAIFRCRSRNNRLISNYKVSKEWRR